ncbi:MAG: zinc ribbon domain-containing protein [Syntrophorhabdaceae bacterium]
MVCSECGAELRENEEICHACGKIIDNKEIADQDSANPVEIVRHEVLAEDAGQKFSFIGGHPVRPRRKYFKIMILTVVLACLAVAGMTAAGIYRYIQSRPPVRAIDGNHKVEKPDTLSQSAVRSIAPQKNVPLPRTKKQKKKPARSPEVSRSNEAPPGTAVVETLEKEPVQPQERSDSWIDQTLNRPQSGYVTPPSRDPRETGF